MSRLAALLALLAGNAFAHPEHGSQGISLAHLLSEPDHLVMLLIPIALAAGAWWYVKKRGKR